MCDLTYLDLRGAPLLSTVRQSYRAPSAEFLVRTLLHFLPLPYMPHAMELYPNRQETLAPYSTSLPLYHDGCCFVLARSFLHGGGLRGQWRALRAS